MSTKHLARFARVGVAVLLVFMACGVTAAVASTQHTNSAHPLATRTTLNIIAEPISSGLDPATAVTDASLRVMELVYDMLLDYNAQGELVPDIAKSWSLSSRMPSSATVIRSKPPTSCFPSSGWHRAQP